MNPIASAASVILSSVPMTDLPGSGAIVPPTVEQLMAELAVVKAQLAAAPAAKPPKMTLEEATAHVATFEGKRGRRPASFHAAMKIVGKVRAKAAKLEAAAAREQKAAVLKAGRKAAKAVEKAQKAADAAAAAELKVQKAQKIATKLNLKMIELTNAATALTTPEVVAPAV